MPERGYNTFHGIVKGRVQGVGYRVYTMESARRHGVVGWVKNLADRSVEVYAQGDDLSLTELLTDLYKGPINGHVEDIDITWSRVEIEATNFEIRR